MADAIISDRSPNGKPTKPDTATLRDLYEVQRLTTRSLGERYHVSKTEVIRWLSRFGIPRRPTNRGLESRGIEPPTRDELHRMIHVEHLGYAGVAEKYGVDPTAVPHWLKKHGVKRPTIWQTRTKGQQPLLDPEKVRSLYESGHTLEQIGAMFGVSAMPVYSICHKYGVPLRPEGFNGTRYTCTNGLEVLSSYEQRVANWLIDRDIKFIYEPVYPFGKRLKADFFANGWWIEIWGITGIESYRLKKQRKVHLCEIHGLPLIEFRHEYFSSRRSHLLEPTLSRILKPPAVSMVQGSLF